MGQQAKAVRMLESRKIVNVKTLCDDSRQFVRALINPSFGTTPRPAVLLFTNGKPVKGYCECPVGPSGICCHILALLLFLKNYWETGDELLELTCTQQLQKWHRRCRKGSIPMLPLAQIKVKAAKVRRAKSGIPKIVAADSEKSSFTRDISAWIKNAEKLIDQTDLPVMDHFHSVLSHSEVGRKSSFGEHIGFVYSMMSLQHHDYAETSEPSYVTFIPKPAPLHKPLFEIQSSHLPPSAIIQQDILPLHVLYQQQQKMYSTDTCKELELDIKQQVSTNRPIIMIDICSLKAFGKT